MTWTHDKPTKAGWYWWRRPGREVTMALVLGPEKGLIFYLPDEESCGDAISVSSAYPDTEWSGPLQVPV